MQGNVSPNEKELSPKQELVIQSMLAGNTIVTSARVASVAEKTVHQWLKLPHFQQAYRSAQRVVFDAALAKLMLKAEKAIDTLDECMSEDVAPPYVRVQAANAVLTHALNINQVNELESRVAELEMILNDIQRQ
jgi:hypothetical protein